MTDRESTLDRCAHCGEPFEKNVRYPLVAERETGELRLHSFCDDGCTEAWRESVARGGE
jgi:hypothetical protein